MSRKVKIFRRAVLAALGAWCIMMPSQSTATDRMKMRIQTGGLLKESRLKFEAAQYDSVLVLLKQVLELDPKNQDAFYHLALTHLARGDTSSAESVLSQGLEAAPLSSRIKLLSARLRLAYQQYDQADNLLAAILRFKPKHSEALYLKGLVNLARGDTTQALDAWQSALENLPAGEVGR